MNRWSPAPEAVTEGYEQHASHGCFACAGFTSDSELFLETLPLTGDESLALCPAAHIAQRFCSWLNALLPDLISALWQRGHAVR